MFLFFGGKPSKKRKHDERKQTKNKRITQRQKLNKGNKDRKKHKTQDNDAIIGILIDRKIE